MKNVTLLDAYGNPIQTANLTKELAAPSLTGVRSVWGQHVSAGLTPEKLAAILRSSADGDADAYLGLCEEMEENEPHYSSVLGTRKRVIGGLPRIVAAASDDARDVEIADAVREQLIEHPDFDVLVEDLLDALGKGYSVSEIMWNRGVVWKPETFIWRDPRFFVFAPPSLSEIRLRDDADCYHGLPLEPFKFIVHKPRLKTGIPLRGGLARMVAFSYMCKRYSIHDWLAFAEIYGLPMRVGRYGPSAKQEDIDVLRAAVANLGSDAAAVLPDSMRIEFQAAVAASGGANLFKGLAEFFDRQTSKAVLGQTMTTDDGSSLGQAKVHDEVRTDIRNSDAKQLAATIKRQLVQPFVDLNFGPQERYPDFEFYIAEPEDIAALSDALDKLVPLGLEVEQSVVRDRLNLPDPAPGAKLLRAPGSQPTTEPAANRQATALNREAAAAGDAIDEIADDMLDDWEPVLNPVLNPVWETLEKATSFDEFRSAIGAMLDDKALDPMTRQLATGLLMARGLGNATDEV